MAIEKVVNIKVNTDATQASSDVNKLKSSLASVTNEQSKLSNAMSGSKESEFINNLGDKIGKLNPAFGSAVKGANGLILKMWEMVANPVGAILAGIVITAKFLYEAFQDSIAGGKELKAAFAALSAVGATVKSAVFELGRALINVTTAAYKFITLDFKGASEDFKKAGQEAANAQNHLGDAVDGTTAKVIQSLTKRQQANDKAAKLQAVTQANTDKLLVKSKEILTDELSTFAQKKKALAEVTAAENKSAKEKLRIAQENLNIKLDEQKLYGATTEMGKKMGQELRDLTIERDHAEQENSQTGFKLSKQRKMLLRQEVSDTKEAAANLKTIADAKKAAAKEAYDADKVRLDEALKEEGLSFQKRRDLIKADRLLNDKDRRKYNAEVNKDEKQFIEAHRKSILDLEKQYITASEDAEDNTAQKRLDREMERKLQLIQLAENSEQERAKLTDFWNAEYDRKQKELNNNEIIDKQNKNLVLANNDKLNFDARLQAVMDREMAEKNIIFKSEDDKLAYEKANSDARIAIANAEKKAKMDAFEGIASSLNGMADLLGKQTAVGKTMAVASATISTIMGAQSAYENALKIPYVGTILAPINAGIAIAAGMKNVQSILAVKTPGGGGGGGGIATSNPPQFNIVGQSGTNQLAQTIAGQQNKPIEAFVVSSAVTTSQALDRNRVKTATFGG